MVKKALTIGINYTTLPNCRLNGCIDDIENITNLIVEHYGYARENVVQLRDDTTNPAFLPTRVNILNHLQSIIAETDKLTEIWIHYSGHGSQIQDRTGEEKDGLDEVIVPIDYNTSGFIIDKEIYKIINNSKCKTILVFDSCHSGTICDLQWTFEFNGNSFIKTFNVNKSMINPNILCLSGCKDSQTATDSYNTELKEPVGAFTDALIHCIKENNYSVSILKLYSDICKYIASQGFNQKPILSSSHPVPNLLFSPTTVEAERDNMPVPFVARPTPPVFQVQPVNQVLPSTQTTIAQQYTPPTSTNIQIQNIMPSISPSIKTGVNTPSLNIGISNIPNKVPFNYQYQSSFFSIQPGNPLAVSKVLATPSQKRSNYRVGMSFF